MRHVWESGLSAGEDDLLGRRKVMALLINDPVVI